jgi:uncharacterized membrane-anchored protein YhcB (DUF1043 family)
MEPLLWIALLAAVVVGMCVGSAINREYSRAFERQAQRSQELVQQLYGELEAAERRAVSVSAEWVPSAPVVVNLHLPVSSPIWSPVINDARAMRPLPALEMER